MIVDVKGGTFSILQHFSAFFFQAEIYKNCQFNQLNFSHFHAGGCKGSRRRLRGQSQVAA